MSKRYLIPTAVTFVCLAFSNPGVAGENTLSDEQALPIAQDARDAYTPSAAWGGGVYLVVWKSGHLGPGDLRKGFNYVGDLAACRVDAQGKLLDSNPVLISTAKDLQERPRVAFDGKNFLVVWQDYRNGKDWDVYAARVTPQGKVLDPNGIPVAAGRHSQALPELTWDGEAFQVVWQDYRSGTNHQVYGARMGSDGTVLDKEGQLLASVKAPAHRWAPVVAANQITGQNLLFWLSSCTRGSKTRVVAGCQQIRGGATVGVPTWTLKQARNTAPTGNSLANFPLSLTAGREEYLGMWGSDCPRGRGNTANDGHAAIFSKDGTLTKKFLLHGKGGVSDGRIRNPSAAWNGSAYVAVWDQKDRKAKKAAKVSWPVEVVCAANVDTSGIVSSLIPISGSVSEPAIKPTVASDGKGAALIAYEKHPAKSDKPIEIRYRVLKSP